MRFLAARSSGVKDRPARMKQYKDLVSTRLGLIQLTAKRLYNAYSAISLLI